MSWHSFGSYVSIAMRRADAEKRIRARKEKGLPLAPVAIEGRAIATTFWGKKWCGHLENFSDYSNRLPRGRTYVRSGAVIDLQICPGEIHAQVLGSRLYRQKITLTPLIDSRWKAIAKSCAGRVDSLVELLQGRFSNAVMDVLCHPADGLFPRSSELRMECSCPDWASLCKHLAAVLYGVGARLDTQPELLFVLRKTDPAELLAEAAASQSLPVEGEPELDGDALSEIFGIDLAPELAPPKSPKSVPGRARKAAPKKKSSSKVPPRKAPAKRPAAKAKAEKPKRATPSKRPRAKTPARPKRRSPSA